MLRDDKDQKSDNAQCFQNRQDDRGCQERMAAVKGYQGEDGEADAGTEDRPDFHSVLIGVLLDQGRSRPEPVPNHGKADNQESI